MKSMLTKNQKKEISVLNAKYKGQKVDLIIELKYDDDCGNGHNTFSITGTLYKAGKRRDSAIIICGCIHEVISELAPAFKKYIKWHLMSSDEPLHYIENTIYHASKIEKYNYYVYLKDEEEEIDKLLCMTDERHARNIRMKYGQNITIKKKPELSNKEPDLEKARASAIAPDATLEQLQDKEWLKERLPKLLEEFKAAMEELGFKY